MFTSLQLLTNLTELRLTYVCFDFAFCEIVHPALKSIKHLSLINFSFTYLEEQIFNLKFNGVQFCQKLSSWFPNLKELFIGFICPLSDIIPDIENNVHLFENLVNYRFEECAFRKALSSLVVI